MKYCFKISSRKNKLQNISGGKIFQLTLQSQATDLSAPSVCKLNGQTAKGCGCIHDQYCITKRHLAEVL